MYKDSGICSEVFQSNILGTGVVSDFALTGSAYRRLGAIASPSMLTNSKTFTLELVSMLGEAIAPSLL